MAYCICGCGHELTGKQKKYYSEDCKDLFWKNARLVGAGKITDVLKSAVSDDSPKVNAIIPGKSKRRGIRFATVIGNPRLEPLLLALIARKKMTSLELHDITGSMAIHTDIAEIRAAGYKIGPAEYVGKSPKGRKIYQYEYIGA